MPPVDGKIQKKLREYKAARWGYRKRPDGSIEKDVFDTYLPVGWADSPANIDVVEIAGEAPAEPVPEAPVEPEPRQTESPVTLSPDWRDMGWPEARKHFFDVTGVRPQSKAEAEAMSLEYGAPPPEEPASAFVVVPEVLWRDVLCIQEERRVGVARRFLQDCTLSLAGSDFWHERELAIER